MMQRTVLIKTTAKANRAQLCENRRQTERCLDSGVNVLALPQCRSTQGSLPLVNKPQRGNWSKNPLPSLERVSLLSMLGDCSPVFFSSARWQPAPIDIYSCFPLSFLLHFIWKSSLFQIRVLDPKKITCHRNRYLIYIYIIIYITVQRGIVFCKLSTGRNYCFYYFWL